MNNESTHAAAAPDLPGFIKDKVERAIHEARNPKGMHTNGPCMASIEVTHLEKLYRFAVVQPSPTTEGERTSEAYAMQQVDKMLAPALAILAGEAPVTNSTELDDGGCWTDDLPCKKCGVAGWHICRSIAARKPAPLARDLDAATITDACGTWVDKFKAEHHREPGWSTAFDAGAKWAAAHSAAQATAGSALASSALHRAGAAAVRDEAIPELLAALDRLRIKLQRSTPSIDQIHEFGADGPLEEAWQIYYDEVMPALAGQPVDGSVNVVTAPEQEIARISRSIERELGNLSDFSAIDPKILALAQRVIDAQTTERMGERKRRPVPVGVYFSERGCDFYRADTDAPMGADFYDRWRDRADDFPDRDTGRKALAAASKAPTAKGNPS